MKRCTRELKHLKLVIDAMTACWTKINDVYGSDTVMGAPDPERRAKKVSHTKITNRPHILFIP